MKVYLDNNVLVDIDYGKFNLSDFLSIQNAEYYYSDAHLSELLEALGNQKVSQEGRLNLISEICGHNYILAGVFGPPEFLFKSPVDIYKYMSGLTAFRLKINEITSREETCLII